MKCGQIVLILCQGVWWRYSQFKAVFFLNSRTKVGFPTITHLHKMRVMKKNMNEKKQ